jgi:hypothetical protein
MQTNDRSARPMTDAAPRDLILGGLDNNDEVFLLPRR